MQSKAATVEQYIAELPPERAAAVSAIRESILHNLPAGYEEGMQYGMIGYYVPHRLHPAGYHCDPRQPLPFAGLASQKQYISIYLMCIYGQPEHEAWFRAAWQKTGKKLDMGKSCIRVRKLEDVPLEVIGQAVKRVPVKKLIAVYESMLAQGGKRAASRQARSITPATKKAASRATDAPKTRARKATAGSAAGQASRSGRTSRKLRKPAGSSS